MIVTIDAVCMRVLDNSTPQVLLKKRDKADEPEFGKYALVGGWVWEKPIKGSNVFDYDINQALNRIIRTKLNASPRFIEQIPSVGSADRDSRDWSLTVVHYCFLNDHDNETIAKKAGYKWVDIQDIIDGSFPLPFDHQYLTAKAWFAFISKAAHSNVGMYAVKESFAIDDIVKTFKAIGVSITKQSMQTRFKAEGIIKETGNTLVGHAGPARTEYKMGQDKVVNFTRILGLEDKYGALHVIQEKEELMKTKWFNA